MDCQNIHLSESYSWLIFQSLTESTRTLTDGEIDHFSNFEHHPCTAKNECR